MRFAPQRRALFRHRNFQKWSDHGVFCTFWLGNVLRATTACTFSTSQLPKVVREWCALYILTWKCASRHNGVQFFISHLASWLRTRRFSEPTFRPSGATNHWKNTVNRDFPTFSRICIFFLLTLSLLIFLFSLPLPYSAFHLSMLSEVWLLNFLRLKVMEMIRIMPTGCWGHWCVQNCAPKMEAMQVTKPTPNRNSRKSWEKNRLTYVAGARIETFDPFSLMKLRDLVKMNPFHKPIKKTPALCPCLQMQQVPPSARRTQIADDYPLKQFHIAD